MSPRQRHHQYESASHRAMTKLPRQYHRQHDSTGTLRHGQVASVALSEKPNGQYLGLICDEYLTCLGLNLNPENFGGSSLLPVSYGETHLLVS
jgi:hypothetical protein